jgi:hypothetical protein
MLDVLPLRHLLKLLDPFLAMRLKLRVPYRVSISVTTIFNCDHTLVTHRFLSDGMTIKPDASPNAQQVIQQGPSPIPFPYPNPRVRRCCGGLQASKVVALAFPGTDYLAEALAPSVTSPRWFREGIGLLKSAALPIPKSYALTAADLVMGE